MNEVELSALAQIVCRENLAFGHEIATTGQLSVSTLTPAFQQLIEEMERRGYKVRHGMRPVICGHEGCETQSCHNWGTDACHSGDGCRKGLTL